jgi:hypothetical protein
MKSEFKKLNKDVLLEWVYDASNLIIEPYKILKNSKDFINSYIAFDSSITNNIQEYQFVTVDASANKFAVVDTSKYSFLSISNYVPSGPVRHDRLKIYFPSNWTFEQYQGFYIRLYTYDYRNNKFVDISNFFYDHTSGSNLLKNFAPPILYQDRTWNSSIEINVPSVYSIALERENGYPAENSINRYLTDNVGLSQTSPIFIDFRFITRVLEVGSVKNYLTTQKVTLQIPQIPQLEALGLYIEESDSGDYFEIYATYNQSFQEFVSLMDSFINIGKVYYLEFDITIFEENIKGKSTQYLIDSDFSQIIEYRPIIKYSTTTSIIDVEMRLINKYDGNIVIRKGAYGMKPDQLSKYLINRKKINVRNAYKPKIYSKNQFSKYRIDQLGKSVTPENILEVPVPELIPTIDYVSGKGSGGGTPGGAPGGGTNVGPGTGNGPGQGSGPNAGNGEIDNKKVISCYSKQALNKISKEKIENYHFMGLLKIGIKPFDNLFKFILAYRFSNNKQLEHLDLTNCDKLMLVFRNDDTLVEFDQFFSSETVAKLGMCQFIVTSNKFNDIKNIFKNGTIVWYITTTNQGIRTTIYSGQFTIMDTADNVSNQPLSALISASDGLPLSVTGNLDDKGATSPSDEFGPQIIDPPKPQEIAIVTRKKIPVNNNQSSTSGGKGSKGS